MRTMVNLNGKSVMSEEEYDQALRRIVDIVNKDYKTEAEIKELRELTKQAVEYERKHFG